MPKTAKTALSRRPACSGRALCLLAGLACAVMPLTALAASPDDRPRPYVEVTDHNAALLYYRVWSNMSSDIDDGYVITADEIGLAEGGREILEANAETIEALLYATRQRSVDWEIEYEKGFWALMPHLGSMRYTTKILAADAVRCAEDGDWDGAAERVAGIYRASSHLSHDRILISSLVGLANTNLANRLVDQLIEQNGLSPQDAATILVAMREIDLSNPIGVREAVSGERDIMVDYFSTNFFGPDAGARIVELMPELFTDEEPMDKQIAAMSGEDLQSNLKEVSRFYNDVLAAWDQPNATGRLAELSEAVENNEYGVLTRRFGAAFSRARQNTEAFVKSHTETMTRLQAIVGD